MSKFDEFVDAVLNGAKDLAKQVFDGLEDNAKEDARAFLEKSEADLKRWTKLLAVKEITERDFADLVHAKKALAEYSGSHFLDSSLSCCQRRTTGWLKVRRGRFMERSSRRK
jgi:hypothetical protein